MAGRRPRISRSTRCRSRRQRPRSRIPLRSPPIPITPSTKRWITFEVGGTEQPIQGLVHGVGGRERRRVLGTKNNDVGPACQPRGIFPTSEAPGAVPQAELQGAQPFAL